jgi:uncharacterized membrane protein
MAGRTIVLADGTFEGALGLVLVVGAAGGRLDSGDFPEPAGASLIAGVGCVLLALGAYLFLLQRRPVVAGLLRALAVCNIVTACAAVAWRLTASGFSTAGSALTLATASALAALAAAQLWAAGRNTAPSVKPGSPPQTMND